MLLPSSFPVSWKRRSGGFTRSPLYGQRFLLHDGPLHRPCYQEIPALPKKENVERGHTAFFADYSEIERGLQEKRYEYESTSGTTQGPMTVIMEDGWWNAQTLCLPGASAARSLC